MANTTVTGSEWLNAVSSKTADIPFRKYLTFGALPDESWDSQSYDPDIGKIVLNFQSTVGSTFKFNSARTGTDSNGSDKGSFTIVGKANGTNMSGAWTNTLSDSSHSNLINLNWTYTGGTASKEDDFKYKLVANNKESSYSFTGGNKTAYSEDDSVDFSNSNYSFSLKKMTNGQWTWSDAAGKNTEDKYSSSFSYSFKDIQNNISINLSSGRLQKDFIAHTFQMDVGSMKYTCNDFSVSTAKFTKDITALWDSSHSIYPEGSDLPTISTNVRDLATFLLADNTITITALTGFEIDAGTGNDTVTGGIGNDIIAGGLGNDIISGGLGNDSMIAGAGKDKLTGGKGDDVYKISKSDYDFTSAKTVLADTIADFKYTATEKDSILLDGFGDVDVFQTLALAKKAGSTANVIYESKTGNFWYNEDGDSALVGALLFANAKGISDTYWVAAGVM